ncbi:MAG: hypothetical protein CMH83_11980 [Nocardioides sp.]|nr:hypothetical protein [Nocardioides sp.]
MSSPLSVPASGPRPASRRLRRPLALVAAAGVAAALTTGCSVAGTDFHPGTAAVVDGSRVTLNEVDEVASATCVNNAYFVENGQSVPVNGGLLREDYVKIAVREIAYEALVDETDAVLGSDYTAAVADAEKQVGRVDYLDEDERASLLEIVTKATYAQYASLAVGQAVLAAEGETSVTDEDAQAAGQEALTDWLTSHDVDLNPIFDLTTDELVGTATVDVPDGVDALPDNQRCG